MPWAIATYYGVSLGVAFLFWLVMAGDLLSLGGLVSTGQINTVQDLAQRDRQLLNLADAISNTITLYYLFVFTLLFGMGVSLYFEGKQRLAKVGSDWGLIALAPLSIAILIVPGSPRPPCTTAGSSESPGRRNFACGCQWLG